MSEKLCLQWNDFQDNIKIAFGNLREDVDFADVTLACEDGQQVEAHKVILAASSPFFQKLLGRNKHPHPLIYLRGIKSEDLLAIVDFLYRGEANVFQENLDSFLAIAEELQLKGLMGKQSDVAIAEELQIRGLNGKSDGATAETQRDTAKMPEREEEVTNATNFQPDINNPILGDKVDMVGTDQTISMMEKTSRKNSRAKPLYICKVCGKEGENSHLKTHIEANHIKGYSILCDMCEKTFSCKNSLRTLNSRNHKDN